MQGWFDATRALSRRVTFPINKWAGSRDSAVYFRSSRVTGAPPDSAEEILYVVAGEAAAEVGDESGRLAAGDLAVIPAMVLHGLVNVGNETLKVVGFFSESEIISSFDEPVQPFGATILNQGAPAPALA
jgi:glyoxylate utilization-related uncharacterized protein